MAQQQIFKRILKTLRDGKFKDAKFLWEGI